MVLPQEGPLEEEGGGEEEKEKENEEEEKDQLLSWTSSVAPVWVPGQLLLMTPLRFSPRCDPWKFGRLSSWTLFYVPLISG